MFIQKASEITLVSLCILAFAGCNQQSSSPSVLTPEVIKFGGTAKEITLNLEGYCNTIKLKTIDPPRLPGAKTHTQIDCQGFDYFGADRLAEFVFLNDKLVLVWVLVEEEELDALDSAFGEAFGPPSRKTETITLYSYAYAAVRYDTPEALYYAPFVAEVVESRIVGAVQ